MIQKGSLPIEPQDVWAGRDHAHFTEKEIPVWRFPTQGCVPHICILSSVSFLFQLSEVGCIQPHVQMRKVRLRVICPKVHD